MPDKDGDEGKSTKSVVNKKQKQMMGEEGYDIARDMGRVRPSKDKKDATTMPPSKEMEKTRKVNKGPSALDIVKKKYKGQIMKMEELDLTKVAEALGGYIVEQTDQENQKQERNIKKKYLNRKKDPYKDYGEEPKDALDYTDKVIGSITPRERPLKVRRNITKSDIERKSPDAYRNPDGTLRVNPNIPNKSDDGTIAPTIGGLKTYKVNPETLRTGVNPTGERKRGRPVGAKDKTQRYVAKNPSKKDEVLAAMTPGQRARNLRRIQKDIDDRNPTIQTQVGPVPYRNRRVPKTRSLVPVFDRTPEIMKPDTDELLKFKDFRKKTKTTTAELDKEQEFKAPPIPQTQTEVPPPPPPINRRRKTGEFDGSRAFNSIKKFAKDNPAAALATYDIGKGILGKIKKYSKAAIKSLNVEKPTKTGRISAGT